MSANSSSSLLIHIARSDIAMFRFLLEARGHTGFFTVLDSHAALLKLFFSPDQESLIMKELAAMFQTVPFSWSERPLSAYLHHSVKDLVKDF